MGKVGCKVTVSGRVQGVGFRYYTSIEARKQNVTGYAKNLDNGKVEIVLYGTYTEVMNMVKWLEKGPKTSNVIDIDVVDIPYLHLNGFPTF